MNTPHRTAGAGLRALREVAGLTLDQVAAEASVSASYLSKVESGAKTATAKWIGHVSGAISRHLTSPPQSAQDRLTA